MEEPELQQLEGLWVDGRPIAYLAAALVRSDLLVGGPIWSLIVTNPSPEIPAGEMEIRVLTRAGISYRSRALQKFDTKVSHRMKVKTTVLQGTEPLVEIGGQVN